MTGKTRNKLLKWLVLTSLLTYVTVMAAWAINCDSNKKCNGIEVYIDNHAFMGDTITRKGVVTELARFDKDILIKPIDKINTRSIERFLSSFSNFESVECYTTSHGTLRIIVTPVIPELRVFDGDQSYYINKDGKRIEANAKFFCDVPVVTGHFSKNFPAKSLLPVTRRIARDSIFSHLVMMIKADGPDDIILVPRVAGHVINIGNASDLDRKLHNVLLAYREIMPYQGWNKYDTISVKFDGRIVATRRDKSKVNHTPELEESVDFDEDAAAAISAGTEEAAAEMTANDAGRKKSATRKSGNGQRSADVDKPVGQPTANQSQQQQPQKQT